MLKFEPELGVEPNEYHAWNIWRSNECQVGMIWFRIADKSIDLIVDDRGAKINIDEIKEIDVFMQSLVADSPKYLCTKENFNALLDLKQKVKDIQWVQLLTALNRFAVNTSYAEDGELLKSEIKKLEELQGLV